MTVAVAPSCTACGVCIATCPTHALLPSARRPHVVDDRCTDCWLCLEVCPVDALTPVPGPHPIEVESYRILEDRLDMSAWPEPERAVVARVVHATADVELAATMRLGPQAVDAVVAALRRRAPLICDAHMLRVGLTGVDAVCLLDDVPTVPLGGTRSAAAIALAAQRYPDGAVWVVGNAPTALAELVRLHAAGDVVPAAVVGLPVGFVGAADAKAALWDSPLRAVSITNVGEKGGTPAAAGAVNALARLVPSERSAGH
ncbi:MAG: precorrin-8X methylmutase [Acidimicrobiales bacterium]